MKERVLFVDDEPNILHALRRMLRSQKTHWELFFANNGPEALELMEGQKIDIVVSDMKMPGMDGAELLNEICKRHPNTIRIILSGYADKEAILRTIGPAHQYLAKPCDHERLLETIKRSLNLRNILTSNKLREIVNGLEALPTPSKIFNKLIQELSEKEASPEKIAAIVESDISLAANFLKLTNSAYFGFRNHNLSLSEAVCQLGTDTIKAIVLVAGSFQAFEGNSTNTEEVNELCVRSLEIGRLTQAIAKALDLDNRTVDQSYIAGTLSKVGTLLLLTKYQSIQHDIKKLLQLQGSEQAEVSRELLGATFNEVGGYLLGIWGFTDPIIEAVVFQCEPSTCSVDAITPLTCVHIAQSIICRQAEHENMDLAYIEQLELTGRIEDLELIHQRIYDDPEKNNRRH